MPSFFAQQVIEHIVYFDSGKDTPTREEKAKLDEVLKQVTNKKLNYSISIYGHTDNIGSNELNKQLSDDRAKNIAGYLKKEFKTCRIEAIGKSYTEPASTDTTLSAKARNRRVYFSINVPVPQISHIGDIKLDKQVYTIDADKNDTLTYSSGTKLIIKSGIFVDASGNKINGKVLINYAEFRDPVDFILSGAHMYYPNKGENMIFNSSGMFDISATQEGKPIFIKKSEEIKVDFVPTKNIESGTDFYKYSTSQNQWSDLSKVPSTANGAKPFIQGHGNVMAKLEICSKDMCEGIRMVIENGCELTKNKTPVFTNLVKKYDLDVSHIHYLDNTIKKYDAQLKVVEKTLDSIQRERDERPAYTFKKIASSSALAFQIDCDTSLKNNFIDLKNVTWSCNGHASKRAASKFMGTRVFAIRMVRVDSRGNAQLRVAPKGYDKSNPILNVKMELPEENTKQQRKEIYKAYRNRVKLAKEYTKSIEKEQDLAEAKKAYLERDRKPYSDSLQNELSNVNKDTAECFWANNKPIMKADEKQMIMLFWYEHLQKNMEEYGQLYNKMKTNNTADDTCAAVTKRIEAAVLKAKLEGNTLVAAQQIMVSLSVGSFGVFNCDQIQRLKKPQEIIASYTDAAGKELQIAFIYLIDDAINSVLLYNGYDNLSPSKFSFSPYSNNRLIAFDEKGEPWLCGYENFKQAVLPKGKKTFILKKVNAVKNKEELTAMK